jgi:hypothetical protein
MGVAILSGLKILQLTIFRAVVPMLRWRRYTYWQSERIIPLDQGAIVKDPEILRDVPVFRGTRVPVQAWFD